MNEFKDELVNDINNVYSTVDFSILPVCLKEAYERRTFYDLIFLMKICDFIDYYDEFRKTFSQKTSMNVKILDYNDMFAYMKLNSKVKIPKTDDIKISQEMIKRLYCNKIGDMILLFDKQVEKINTLSDIYLKKKQKEFDEYAYKLSVINKFIDKIIPLPKEAFRIFISWSDTKKTTIEKLFNKLTFEEKFIVADIIMNNAEHEIDPNNLNLMIVCKQLLGEKMELSSDILKKHIMLRLMYYKEDSDQIAESIIQDAIYFNDVSPDNFKTKIKTAAIVINSVHSDIEKVEIEKNIRGKCLRRLENVKRTAMILLQNA